MTRRRRWTSALLLTLLLASASLLPGGDRWLHGGPAEPPAGLFVAAPYLQLGDNPAPAADGREALDLLWETLDRPDEAWAVEVRAGAKDAPWAPAPPPSSRRVAVDGQPAMRVHRAALTGLRAGEPFGYRVRLAGRVVFEAEGSARKPAGKPHRFVVFGDCAADTPGQRAIAYRTHQTKPDYVVVTGDIVYARGRVSEYLDHFFPVYNHAEANPALGAPLLRSTLFVAAPGNHDLVERDLDKYPDGLAYFYYWSQPLNGPLATPDAPNTPATKGSPARAEAYRAAAGPGYPRMANFSWTYGDVHWTMLDSNPYADWTDPALRGWLEADLAAAKGAAWRVVAFHHPPFHASHAHADDQRMRVLAPTFEAGGVSVVFAGHVHNYERSKPLKFVPDLTGGRNGRPYGPGGQVGGRWTLDGNYDGDGRARPDGVIYVVSGAGGAKLYDPDQNDDPASWKDYTARFVSSTHSITVVDAAPDALTVRQVAADGHEIDRFAVRR